jgi:hypothetical protein
VAEAQRVLLLLGERRNMSVNEVRLVLMVEDPRVTQRREQYGVEVESGVSRDDILVALADVQAGVVPRDGLALRQLVAELQAWPYLAGDEALRAAAGGVSQYAAVTDTGLSKAERLAQAKQRASIADDTPAYTETPEKDLSDFLPKWVGFSAVYAVRLSCAKERENAHAQCAGVTNTSFHHNCCTEPSVY